MTGRVPGVDVLYVGTLPPHPGGSAVSCGQLLVGLAQAGARIRAIAPVTPDTLRRGDGFAAAHPELSITRIPLPFFEINPPTAPPDYRAAEGTRVQEAWATQLADRRPDVVFIGRETFAWHVVPLARSAKLPALLRLAGMTINALIEERLPPPDARSLLAKLQQVDLIVSPGAHLAATTRRLGLSNVTTIRNALDLTAFTPRPKDPELLRSLDLGDGDVIVVHASNFKPAKRPLEIAQAARDALRQCPRLAFVIVGDGPMRERMKQICRGLGVWERFRFVDWVPYQEMPRFINLADVVVMPSSEEGLARVYMETQACGRLLVASDIAAAREVIVDGETGLLFRMGHLEELTEKLVWAGTYLADAQAIGRRARAHAVGRFGLDRAVAAYTRALADLVAPPTQGLLRAVP